jgi:hypothetical protein
VSAPHRDLPVLDTPRLRLASWVRDAVDELAAPRAGVAPIEPGAFRRVFALWLVARVTSLSILFGFFVVSRAARWTFGPTGGRATDFLHFLTEWDAARYGAIAGEGYPLDLPLDVAGNVLPNNWAFMPLFPWEIRALTAVGIPWELAGVLLSTAASLGATWMLFLLLRRVAPPLSAWWGTVFFSFGPLAFVYVLAYAEAQFLFLTFAALLLAMQRRYLWILPVGVASAYTRPGSLALALCLGIVFLARWTRHRADPFPPRQWIALFVTGMVLAGAGLSWTVIAERVTGVTNAYIRTELGWWLGSVGNDPFAPFTPWFRQAGTHLGVVGILLVVALMGAFAALLCSRAVRRLGPVVLAYAFSYGLYLFAVFLPQQSTFRLMMPLSPLLGDERLSATPRRRVGILIGCILLQIVAVLLIWTLGHP